jgi:hypothetical protein
VGATLQVCQPTGSCTYDDIQDAVIASSPGDTIQVINGSYDNFEINSTQGGDNLTIVATNKSAVKINSSLTDNTAKTGSITIRDVSNFSLTNLTVYDAIGTLNSFGLFISNSTGSVTSITVEECDTGEPVGQGCQNAVKVRGGSDVDFTNLTLNQFYNSETDYRYSAILITNSNFTITGLLMENYSTGGFGIAVTINDSERGIITNQGYDTTWVLSPLQDDGIGFVVAGSKNVEIHDVQLKSITDIASINPTTRNTALSTSPNQNITIHNISYSLFSAADNQYAIEARDSENSTFADIPKNGGQYHFLNVNHSTIANIIPHIAGSSDDNTYDGLSFLSCTNLTVEDVTSDYHKRGVYIFDSDNITLDNVNVTNAIWGLYAINSSDILLQNSNFSSSTKFDLLYGGTSITYVDQGNIYSTLAIDDQAPVAVLPPTFNVSNSTNFTLFTHRSFDRDAGDYIAYYFVHVDSNTSQNLTIWGNGSINPVLQFNDTGEFNLTLEVYDFLGNRTGTTSTTVNVLDSPNVIPNITSYTTQTFYIDEPSNGTFTANDSDGNITRLQVFWELQS